jgi:quercetin dioxygenase-like cupin family protein
VAFFLLFKYNATGDRRTGDTVSAENTFLYRSLCRRAGVEDGRNATLSQGEKNMHKYELDATRKFNPLGMQTTVLHESEYFKIINFNLSAGHLFPVHSHDLDGQVAIHVIEGSGEFLGGNGRTMPAKEGDILVSDISEPHGVKAATDMRLVVTIAPPI